MAYNSSRRAHERRLRARYRKKVLTAAIIMLVIGLVLGFIGCVYSVKNSDRVSELLKLAPKDEASAFTPVVTPEPVAIFDIGDDEDIAPIEAAPQDEDDAGQLDIRPATPEDMAEKETPEPEAENNLPASFNEPEDAGTVLVSEPDVVFVNPVDTYPMDDIEGFSLDDAGAFPVEEPETEPAEEPVIEPAEEPAIEPAEEPAIEPAEEPAIEPAEEPAIEPAEEPAIEPAEEPAIEPAEEPAIEPAEEPAIEPAEEPAIEPAEEPAIEPTEEPAEEEAPVQEETIVVPYGETCTFDAEIFLDGTARTETSDEAFEKLNISMKIDAHKDTAYFEKNYAESYNLQGNEAAVEFDLTLNEYTGSTTIIPQNFLLMTLSNADDSATMQGFQLMDTEIAGKTDVAVSTDVTATLYKRYPFDAAMGDMEYLIVTAYSDGVKHNYRFEINKSAEQIAAEEEAAAAEAAARALTIGSQGEEVKKLQQKLIDLKLLTGQPDGKFGKYTAGAVAEMQRKFGMEPTGIADGAFLDKLYE